MSPPIAVSVSISGTFFTFFFLFLLQWNPSHARRLNEPQAQLELELDQDNDNDKYNNKYKYKYKYDNKYNSNLGASRDIPPLHDTLELVRLSGLVYQFREKRARDCSAFPSIYDDFFNNDSSMYYDDSGSNGNSGGNSGGGGNFTFTCHMYERDELDTQVLVVSRTRSATSTETMETVDPNQDYIAVVYAGTDDFRNALTDTNLRTKYFGPESYFHDDDDNDNHDDKKHNHNHNPRNYTFPPTSQNIRVHAGFNNAVFKHGLFDRIYDTVTNFVLQNPKARVVTTGHSLGASDAVLTAVALKIQPFFQDSDITDGTSNGSSNNNIIHSINFGCPKTGNVHWVDYVNSIPNLGIWRVVNGLDIVPRMPGMRFHHVGHTLQLDKRIAKAYWLHDGNVTLGYAGVPFGWNTLPYALAPVAAYGHLMSHYYKYVHNKSIKDPTKYYFDGFEMLSNGTSNDTGTDTNDQDEDEDDIYSNPPDDDLGAKDQQSQEEFGIECAKYYMDYLATEKKMTSMMTGTTMTIMATPKTHFLKDENFGSPLDDKKKESL